VSGASLILRMMGVTRKVEDNQRLTSGVVLKLSILPTACFKPSLQTASIERHACYQTLTVSTANQQKAVDLPENSTP